MKKLERAPRPDKYLPNSDELLLIIKSESLNALLSKIQEKYYYWDKVKRQPILEGIKAQTIWSITKLRRMNTPYKAVFGEYRFYWNLNSRLNELLHFLDLNIGGNLASSSIISNKDKNKYLLGSVMEEAIASSQIEGAATTRKHAKDMLRKNIKPRSKDEQMIVNNFISIQKILEIKAEPLTKEKLLSLHKLVTQNTLLSKSEEGALREDNSINVINTATGAVLHHPPPVKELDELLSDLFRFFNEDESDVFIHPIVKACIIHFMIGFIHPFVDGNGRTARALFYWYLLKKEYWLTEYLSISRLILRSKAQYGRAFLYTEVDDGDMTYFIFYKLRAMKLAFEELRAYIKRKNEEKKRLYNFIGIDGINYRQAQILEWFSQEAGLFLTVKEVEKRLGVSNMSARTDLNNLLAKGYLEGKKLNKLTMAYSKGKGLNSLLKYRKNNIGIQDNNISNQPTLFN
jgi:Fic family protein